MPDPVVTRQPVKNEHVKIESTKAFVEVRAALESLVPQLDARIFVLLQYGESDRARKELERGPELSIFNSRDHGGLLQITGLVLACAEQAGLATLDLFETIDGAVRSRGLRAIYRDAHPSPVGTEIAARRIADELKNRHLLPSP